MSAFLAILIAAGAVLAPAPPAPPGYVRLGHDMPRKAPRPHYEPPRPPPREVLQGDLDMRPGAPLHVEGFAHPRSDL